MLSPQQPTLQWCSSAAFLSLSCRRQLERANAEEEQIAAEALQQVQAERQRDQDTNFQLLLQAEEIKVTAPAFAVVAACQSLSAHMWQQHIVLARNGSHFLALRKQPEKKLTKSKGYQRQSHKLKHDMTCAPVPCTRHGMNEAILIFVDCASVGCCLSAAYACMTAVAADK